MNYYFFADFIRRITRKINTKPFGLYSVCEWFAGVGLFPRKLFPFERSLWLWMGKWCPHLFYVTMNPVFIKLTGYEHRHKISEEFGLELYLTSHLGVTCPWEVININDVSSFAKLGCNEDSLKRSNDSILGRIGSFSLESFARERGNVSHTYNGENNVCHLLFQFIWIQSSSNLQVTRTSMKCWIVSSSSQVWLVYMKYMKKIKHINKLAHIKRFTHNIMTLIHHMKKTAHIKKLAHIKRFTPNIVTLIHHIKKTTHMKKLAQTKSFTHYIMTLIHHIKKLAHIKRFAAYGVVQCGGRKTSPLTSTIVQLIFYFWSFEISVNILRHQ